MQISNVFSGLADPTSWGKKGETAVQSSANALMSADSQVKVNPAAATKSADILRQYDVTRISPEGFSQMVQKLYKAGVLTEKDYQELAAVRTELERAGVEPNEEINMLEFYSDKLSKAQKELGVTLEEAARQQSLAPDMRRLDWLQKFAVVQANPDAAGLDIAA
jgi:hypothetical protein